MAYNRPKIGLLSKSNLCAGGTVNNSYSDLTAFDLFSSTANRVRTRNGSAVTYWTGTYTKTGSYYYYDHVTTTGSYQSAGSLSGTEGVTNNRGVVFFIMV